MRVNSREETIKRNYVQVYQHYIAEYEQVKRGNTPATGRLGNSTQPVASSVKPF